MVAHREVEGEEPSIDAERPLGCRLARVEGLCLNAFLIWTPSVMLGNLYLNEEWRAAEQGEEEIVVNAHRLACQVTEAVRHESAVLLGCQLDGRQSPKSQAAHHQIQSLVSPDPRLEESVLVELCSR